MWMLSSGCLAAFVKNEMFVVDYQWVCPERMNEQGRIGNKTPGRAQVTFELDNARLVHRGLQRCSISRILALVGCV